MFTPENFNINRQGLPLPVELFQVEDGYYVFDANRVVFLEVNHIIFEVLSFFKRNVCDPNDIALHSSEFSIEEIREAIKEIEEFQSQGYFKPMDFKRHNPFTLTDIKEHLSSKLKGIFFNITSKCNLACSYCVLSGEYLNHTGLKQQEMTWETASKAIDFFISRSGKEGTFRVDFIGGEPFMAFPLMKRIVNSLKEKLLQRDQKLFVAITSNGTIINNEIIDFLVENDVLLQCSIDGIKQIHDSNRKFKGSTIGSFDTVLKNLQLVYDRNKEYFLNHIRLKSVITTEAMDVSDSDFFDIPLINMLFDRKRLTMVNRYPHYDLKKDEDYFSRIHKLGEILLRKKDVSTIVELLDGLTYKSKNLYFATFNYFFDIQVINYIDYEIDQPIPFSKNCLIGIEGSVNPDGTISICYNADTFIIGNVLENTWYFDKIAEYNDKRYGVKCDHCFVKRFCNLCYEKLNDSESNLSVQIKNHCQFTRYFYRTIFDNMLRILKRNPKLWNITQKMAEDRKKTLLEERATK